MLTKIYNMQKLLLQNGAPPFGSGNSNVFAAQKYTNLDKAFAISILAISSIYLFTVDQSMIFILMASFTALIIGGFTSYNSDIIGLLPVSKKFKFINLYLAGFILFLIEYIILIGISYLFYGLLYLSAFLINGGNIAQSSDVSNNILGMEASILFLLLVAMYYLIILTIIFIKNQKIRFSCGVGFSLCYLAFLHILKNKIASNPNTSAAHDMLNKFQLLPNKLEFLKNYSIATTAILALSILISYLLYKGKN
ncbi:hypothetical protein JK636_16550 [Clostridium sp. YIM B02515]|uniref:ABC-2 family transporter protein n=1 Tax=Clostridium rhizosphaerae TaxID=2803861 RepID=A0ABS1TDD2_9CLOT|nr:hypothetical protein [Clostridium rhizosphaerae]MBL4937340.1 hypothetical protein [Clostridium rhizosphaerae]